jgi:protein-tyrosine-phosphatase
MKSKKKSFTVLFVCSGNSCRSPIAKGLMDKIIADNSIKNFEIRTFSAGSTAPKGKLPSDNAQKAAKKFGVDISNHLSAPLTRERIVISDLILAMEQKHKTAVLELVPEAKKKTFVITEYANKDKQGIIDPFGQSLAVYERTTKQLYEILKKVYNKITKKR